MTNMVLTKMVGLATKIAQCVPIRCTKSEQKGGFSDNMAQLVADQAFVPFRYVLLQNRTPTVLQRFKESRVVRRRNDEADETSAQRVNRPRVAGSGTTSPAASISRTLP